LPFRVVDGVKVFHLTTGEFEHEFAPGLRTTCWGYNGRTIGPTIEAVEGDRVRIYVTNRLPEPTSVHWHGIILPSGMDGVAGLSHPPIPVGATYRYEFDLHQFGTYMYHPHYDEMTQQALGMMGMFIVHQRGERQRPDKDFVMLSSEWRVGIGTSRPDPNEMLDFNVLTFNGKAFPGTAPLVIRLGDAVRIRFGNLSAMSHHPIHVHGMALTNRCDSETIALRSGRTDRRRCMARARAPSRRARRTRTSAAMSTTSASCKSTARRSSALARAMRAFPRSKRGIGREKPPPANAPSGSRS